jgi:pilus assembly protein CpaE
MPVIVESDSASADLLRSAVPRGAHVVVNLEALKAWLTQKSDEYAVVIGPGVDMQAAAALADTLRLTRPATSVVLVRRKITTSILAEAMTSGMREVVEERDLTGLTAAVTRAAQVWAAINGPIVPVDGGAGRIVTVFSPKGGVGKTTMAVNLAIALADGGARKVCLVDLDLGFGDVAITLQLFPHHTIFDAVPMADDLDFGVLEKLLTRHEDGLMVMAAPAHPDAKDKIPGTVVSRVLRLLRENFEYVVVDTWPNFEEQVLHALDETDDCVLVTTLDVPTLKNVKIALETLDLLNFASGHRMLVLNRADDKVGLTQDKVETILGMKVAVAVPSAIEVASSTNAGRPIVSAQPNHPVSKAIGLLANSLLTGPATRPELVAGETDNHAGKRSLLTFQRR